MIRQLKIQPMITGRDSAALKLYLAELSRMRDEEADEDRLAERLMAGGKDAERARRQLVNANLRFVVSVAKQYQHKGLELEDLISEGNIGLLKAAERFDPNRGFRFISYAVWWVRQSIMQAIVNNGRIIRLPQNQFSICSLVSRESQAFSQLEGRKPTTEELMTLTGLTESQILLAQKSDKRTGSLDAPLGEDSDTMIVDTLTGDFDAPDKNVDKGTLSEMLIAYLNKVLRKRDTEVLCRCFGIGKQPQELETIATDMGLSRERVRQIREKSIDKLRTLPGMRQFRQFIA